MATNDFIGFASNGNANIMSQADYAAAMEQGNGVQPGMASSALANKIWRQGANMASAIGAFIASHGYDALDNGDINTLKTNFESALWQTGTWTPELVGDIIPGTYTYKRQSGTFIKIEKFVYITADIEIGAYTVHPDGRAYIAGLPFAVKGNLTAINVRGTLGLSSSFYKCTRAVTGDGYSRLFLQGIDQSNNVVNDLIFSNSSQTDGRYLSLYPSSGTNSTGHIVLSGVYESY